VYETFLRASFKHRRVHIFTRPSRYHTMIEHQERNLCQVCKNPLPSPDHGVANEVLLIFHCSNCAQRVKNVWYDYSHSSHGRRRKRTTVWKELHLEVSR